MDELTQTQKDTQRAQSRTFTRTEQTQRDTDRASSYLIPSGLSENVGDSSATSTLNSATNDEFVDGINEVSPSADIEFNGSVLICINGSPYWIDIPYDDDTGPYDGTGAANFPISEP